MKRALTFTRPLQSIVVIGEHVELQFELGNLSKNRSMVVRDALERLVEVTAKVNVRRCLVIRESEIVPLGQAQIYAVQPVADLFERRVLLYTKRPTVTQLSYI